MSPKVSRRNQRRPRIAPLLHAPDGSATRACHEALRAEPFWSNLGLDGFTPGPSTGASVLELRRCPQCGACIAKQVSLLSAFETLGAVSKVIRRSVDALASSISIVLHRPTGRGGHA